MDVTIFFYSCNIRQIILLNVYFEQKNGHNLIIHLLMYVQYAGTHEISLPFYYFFLERFLLLILTNKKFKDVFFPFLHFHWVRRLGMCCKFHQIPGLSTNRDSNKVTLQMSSCNFIINICRKIKQYHFGKSCKNTWFESLLLDL